MDLTSGQLHSDGPEVRQMLTAMCRNTEVRGEGYHYKYTSNLLERKSHCKRLPPAAPNYTWANYTTYT